MVIGDGHKRYLGPVEKYQKKGVACGSRRDFLVVNKILK